jgi:hypothetical protein
MNKSTEKKAAVVEISTALPRAKYLGGEEEKVLRMRYGAQSTTTEPLPRFGEDDPDLASEMLLIEMDLFRQARERANRAKVVPISSKTKDKIVRALRRR